MIRMMKRQFLLSVICRLSLVVTAFSAVFVKSLRPPVDVVLAPGFSPLRWLGAEGPFHNSLLVLLGFLLNAMFYTVAIWLLPLRRMTIFLVTARKIRTTAC